MAEAAKPAAYVDPKEIDIEQLRQEVAQVETYLKDGNHLTPAEQRQFARAKRDLARMERGEGDMGTTQRLGTVAAQAPTRGALSLLGLPVDLANLYLQGAGAVVRAIGPDVNPAHIPGGSADIQRWYTQDLPKAVGLNPFIQPDTPLEKIVDMGVQGATSGAMGAVSGVPLLSNQAQIAKGGAARTALQEGVAGTTAGIAGSIAHEAGASLPVEMTAGVAGGMLGSGRGLMGIINALRTSGTMTADDWVKMVRIGTHAQRLIAGGTPEDTVKAVIMQQFKNEGMDHVTQKIQEEMVRQGMAPEGYQPTLGGITDNPLLLHLERSANPAMQGPIRRLETTQRPTGVEAVLGGLYDESSMTRPPGALTTAVEQGNLTVETQPLADMATPRLREELRLSREGNPLTGEIGTDAYQRGIEDQMQGVIDRRELGVGDLNLRRDVGREARATQADLGKEDITQRARTRQTIIETEKAQEIAQLKDASASRMQALSTRALARNTRRLAKASEDLDTIATRMRSPREGEAPFETGLEVRKAFEDVNADVNRQAAEWYAPFKEEGLRQPMTQFHTRMGEIVNEAIAAEMPQRYPHEALRDFRRGLEVKATNRAKEAVRGTDVEPRAITDITTEDVEFQDLMAFRSNVLRWQRENGASRFSNAVVTEIDEAMTKMADDLGRSELVPQLREASAKYKQAIRPLVTFIGEDILAKTVDGPSYRMQMPDEVLPDGAVRPGAMRDVSYRVPMSNVVSKIIDSQAPHEAIEQFVTIVGSRAGARAAVEEMLAHKLFVDMGAHQHKITTDKLNDWRMQYAPLFSALRRAGMESVPAMFDDVRAAQAKIDEITAAGQQLKERLADVEAREAQRVAERVTRITEQGKEAITASAEQTRQERSALATDLRRERTTEAQTLGAERQALLTRLAAEQLDVRNQQRAADALRKTQEHDIMRRYLTPNTPNAAPEVLATELDRHLRSNLPRVFARNVETLRNMGVGDPQWETAVRRVVVEELWKRAKGNPTQFKALMAQNTAGLQAADLTPPARKMLNEYATMLEAQQRTPQPGTQAGLAAYETDNLFLGGRMEQNLGKLGGYLGGAIGAVAMGQQGYRLGGGGGAGGLIGAGVGVMTGRSIGAGMLSSMFRKVGQAMGNVFDARAATLIEESVFRPDLRALLLAIQKEQGKIPPLQRAKLHSYLVTLGLPTRTDQEGETPSGTAVPDANLP